MVTNKKLNRINELAKKSKTTGLSDKEKNEQKALRQEYLNEFKRSFKDQIEHTTVIDPEGKDVTPEKIKQMKKNNKK